MWVTNKDGGDTLQQKAIVSEREIPLEDMDARHDERSGDESSCAHEHSRDMDDFSHEQRISNLV